MATKKLTLQKVLPFILIVGGTIGLIASLILSYDTLKISANPHYAPACSLNPVLSCGSVINATGDHLFGLPYPFFGIAVFAVLITVGASMLAGAVFKRWFWLGLQAGAILGLCSAYWLLFKSVHVIHALCPYCLTVDIFTTIMVWYITLYNIDQKNIRLPKGQTQAVYVWIRRHHLDLLVLWFLIIIALVLKHFWYYYGKHL